MPTTADFGDKESGFELSSVILPATSEPILTPAVAGPGTESLEHAHSGCQRRDPADSLREYPGTQKRGYGIQGLAGRDSLQQRHGCCLAQPLSYFPGDHALGTYSGGWEEGTGDSTCSGAQDPMLSAEQPCEGARNTHFTEEVPEAQTPLPQGKDAVAVG